MTRFLLILALSLLQTVALAAEERTLEHNGQERRYLIEGNAAGPNTPAIVLLHGGAGTAERARRTARLTLPGKGWVAIYPQGLENRWNDGRRVVQGPPLSTSNDVGFLRSLMEELIAEGLVDAKQIYFAGVSNGGAMTQRMLCEAPELVAGAVSVIMTYPIGIACPPSRPIPLMFQLGMDDPIVPYEGGPITLGKRDRGGVMPAIDTYAFYARRNACNGVEEVAMPDRDAGDGTRSVRLRYQNCAAPLEALIVRNGGHTWSGTPNRPMLEALLGKTAQDFSATDEMEAFFLKLAAEHGG